MIVRGLPAEQVAILARSRAGDRVIVASRYACGVARLLEGSVAEELITTLEVPVCVIGRRTRPGAASGTPLGNILLATSLHPGSALLASFASRLAEVNHSHLTLLHVLETGGMSEPQREAARLEALQRLSALVPNEARQSYQPAYLVKEGDPAAVILDEAGSMSQDVVILGSPHSSMVARPLTDSVVHRVVVESQCPVFTINSSSACCVEDTERSAGMESIPADARDSSDSRDNSERFTSFSKSSQPGRSKPRSPSAARICPGFFQVPLKGVLFASGAPK
ncbi:MAG: universal stress protein [Terracidiphilus sp.]